MFKYALSESDTLIMLVMGGFLLAEWSLIVVTFLA